MSTGIPVEHLGMAVAAVTVGVPLLEVGIRPLTAAQRCVAREITLTVLAAAMLSPWVRPIAPLGTDLTIAPAWLGLIALPGVISLVRWMRSAYVLGQAPWEPVAAWDGVPVGEADVRSPMVFGVFAPHIVLPRGAGRWPHAYLEATRVHELAHVGRRDLLRWPVLQGLGLILGFHPLFHACVSRWLRDAELAADRRATRSMAPAAYASALLDLHAHPSDVGARVRAGSAFLVLRPADLAGRIESVLRPSPPPPAWRFLAPSALLAGLMGFVAWVPNAPPPPPCDPTPPGSETVVDDLLDGWKSNTMLDFQHDLETP